jgi:hypothetical protein
MRYFTADRWLRLQHGARSEEALHALEEWEQAIANYRTAVSELLRSAPRELKTFSSSVCLHDAVLVQTWRERKKLFLLLRLAPPEQGTVLLTYTLVAPPLVSPSGIPEQYHTHNARWMYDEIEAEEPPVLQHRILFSNGWEICLRFTSFSYCLPQEVPLFPPGVRDGSSRLPVTA